MLEAESTPGPSNDLIGTWSRDFLASSIVPQPTTLPRGPFSVIIIIIIIIIIMSIIISQWIDTVSSSNLLDLIFPNISDLCVTPVHPGLVKPDNYHPLWL
jgi:hypothetical protein